MIARASFIASALAVFACGVIAQTTPKPACPDVSLFASAQAITEGDKVTFNLSVAGGDYDLERLKYRWRIYPKGYLVAGALDTVVVLDTSTVHGNWAIVSVDVEGLGINCWMSGSRELAIRRKGPYTKADEFWWWFQLNSERFRWFEEPEYPDTLKELGDRLREVDARLTFRIDRNRKDPINFGLIIGFKDRPYDAKVVDDFIARRSSLAGWEFEAARLKP